MRAAPALSGLAMVAASRCPNEILSDNPKTVFDVFLLQDATTSSGPFPAGIQDEYIPAVFDLLVSSKPLGNRMGLMTFTDHPLPPLGMPTDSCARFEQLLTDDSTEFDNAAGAFTPGGGNDEPQAHLLAVQHVLRSLEANWRPNDYIDPGGRPLVKMVLVATNSPFHDAGDGVRLGPRYPSGRPYIHRNNDDRILECGIDGDDYPNYGLVMSALDEHDAVMGILTTAGLVAQWEAAIARYWDPTRVFVVAVESDLSDYVDGVTRAIEGLTYGCDDECDPNVALEVVYLQDLSNSVRPYLDHLRATVPSSLQELQSYYPAARFAAAGFTEQPAFPHNACYWTYDSLTSDVRVIADVFQTCGMSIRSSIDWTGTTMEALLQLAEDPRPGFTTTEFDPEGRAVHRSILVFTNDPLLPGPPEIWGPMTDTCLRGQLVGEMEVAAALAAIGAAETHVAFAVPDELLVPYAALATSWSAVGVPTTVHPLSDLGELFRSTDVCGLIEPSV